MRLSSEQINALHCEIDSIITHVTAVRLFGSRLDDTARGGDIDLMISVEKNIENPAELSARLAVRISRAMGNRKVDVVLQAPNLANTTIHEIALKHGVLI